MNPETSNTATDLDPNLVPYVLPDHQSRREFEGMKHHIQSRAVDRIAACELADIVRGLPAPVLVTGSSGYLGSSICLVLQRCGIAYRGVDIAKHPSADCTAVFADISDLEALREAARGCKTVFHTAALHAPNMDYFDEENYNRVNVTGTQNVLQLARENQMCGIVHSSTTSLMNTAHAKQLSKTRTVVMHERSDYGEPRNKYGRSKRKAEALFAGRSLDDGCCAAVILRCSRFFPEDSFDTDKHASEREQTTGEAPEMRRLNANRKANEILAGTRASLFDMVTAHILAMRVAVENTARGRGEQVETLIVSSRVHFDLDSAEAAATELAGEIFTDRVKDAYAKHGWEILTHVPKVYDSRNCQRVLGWNPSTTSESIVADLSSGAGAVDEIVSGYF